MTLSLKKVINYNEKRVRIRHFTQDEKDSANEQYAQIEKSIDKTKEAIVLVAVSDVKELREAYPSYFLNSGEFIAALSDFQHTSALRLRSALSPQPSDIRHR